MAIFCQPHGTFSAALRLAPGIKRNTAIMAGGDVKVNLLPYTAFRYLEA